MDLFVPNLPIKTYAVANSPTRESIPHIIKRISISKDNKGIEKSIYFPNISYYPEYEKIIQNFINEKYEVLQKFVNNQKPKNRKDERNKVDMTIKTDHAKVLKEHMKLAIKTFIQETGVLPKTATFKYAPYYSKNYSWSEEGDLTNMVHVNLDFYSTDG